MEKLLFKIICVLSFTFIGVSNLKAQEHWLATISGPVPFHNGDYQGKRLVLDADGNSYTTGTYGSSSTASNRWASAYNKGQTGSTGTSELKITNTGTATNKWNSFVAKADSTGTFQWMIGMGSSNTIDSTITNAIAVDDVGTGAVYVGGRFNKQINSFSGSPLSTYSSLSLVTTGNYDGFLIKMSKDGEYLWHKTFSNSSSSIESVRDITTDLLGNLIVVGTYQGKLLIDGVEQLSTSKGGVDVFIAKFNTNGTLEFIKSIGGSGADAVYSVITDLNGNIYTTGTASFGTTTEPIAVSVDTEPLISGSGINTWLAKFNSNGNIVWAKAMSSSSQAQYAYGIAVDKESDTQNRGVYITGTLNAGNSSVDFAGFELTETISAHSPFVAKFSADTGTGLWAKVFPTGGSSTGNVISVNGNKDVFVGGAVLTSINFGSGDIENTGTHAYIVKLNSLGIVQNHKIIKSAASSSNNNVDRVLGLAATNFAIYATGQGSGSSVNSATPNFADIPGANFYYRGGSWNAFIIKWNSTTLPVTLTDFKGSKTTSGNQLSWNTLSESKNAHFEVERSTDGINFTTIQTVNTKAVSGNSTAKLSYSYTDASPLAGVNYYRLKQVDNDGKFAYSENVIAISNSLSENNEIKVYPNPGSGNITIQFSTASAGREVNVYNKAGQLVKSFADVLGSSHVIDITSQPSGVYFIQVLEKGKSNLIKYIKQ